MTNKNEETMKKRLIDLIEVRVKTSDCELSYNLLEFIYPTESNGLAVVALKNWKQTVIIEKQT